MAEPAPPPRSGLSPCVKRCAIHPQARICTGCLRTLEEIAGWSGYSDDRRRAIMDGLDSRRALLGGTG